MNAEPFEIAKRIVITLREAGHESYFVGGSVRDLLLHRTSEEYDIVTSATPSQIRSLFPRTVPVGERFGVILIVEKECLFEVASYRTEDAYLDGRRPSQVTLSSSAEDDVRRRDFTINGLLMDPVTGRIIDFVNGRKDIENRTLRTIGDPDERFAEDHLRMLRAIRFAANLGFQIDPETFSAVKKNAALICNISAERIRDELTKILIRGDSRLGLELLSESGLLQTILPEIGQMQQVSQPPAFHPEGDVWEHTLQMLRLLSELEDDLRSDSRLAWGALLHDIGKPDTRTQDQSGIHFYGHSHNGEQLAADILTRLRFPRQEIETIASLIRHHMQFMNVTEMRPNRLIRFLRMPDFQLHLELHRLDCLASHGHLDTYEFCRAKLDEIPAEKLRPAPLITGIDLIDLGFKPGPLFGEILKTVETAQLDAELHTREEAVDFVLNRWGNRRHA